MVILDGQGLCKIMTSNVFNNDEPTKPPSQRSMSHDIRQKNVLTVHSKYISKMLQLGQKVAAYPFQELFEIVKNSPYSEVVLAKSLCFKKTSRA